jgi:hypothetical protein
MRLMARNVFMAIRDVSRTALYNHTPCLARSRDEETRMNQITDGWEIVARRTNEPTRLLSMLLQIVVLIPEMPASFSTVTWTVRQTATGVVHKVTARSEQEAMDKIAVGAFDTE